MNKDGRASASLESDNTLQDLERLVDGAFIENLPNLEDLEANDRWFEKALKAILKELSAGMDTLTEEETLQNLDDLESLRFYFKAAICLEKHIEDFPFKIALIFYHLGRTGQQMAFNPANLTIARFLKNHKKSVAKQRSGLDKEDFLRNELNRLIESVGRHFWNLDSYKDLRMKSMCEVVKAYLEKVLARDFIPPKTRLGALLLPSLDEVDHDVREIWLRMLPRTIDTYRKHLQKVAPTTALKGGAPSKEEREKRENILSRMRTPLY